MRVSFALTVFGQRFAFESRPEDAGADDGPDLSAVSETERDPIGFSATPAYYYEEERRR